MLNYSGESYYVLSHYGNVCQFVYGQVMFRIQQPTHEGCMSILPNI